MAGFENSEKTFANLNILVVEDEIINQLVVTKILADAGYASHTVSDGCQVIKALECSDYDLVLMDYFLPGMDGVAVTRAIRGRQSESINPDIPIIALTALNSNEELEKCKAAGMNAVVSKPVRPQQLLATITRLLGGDCCKNSSPGRAERVVNKPEVPKPSVNNGLDEALSDEVIDQFLQAFPLDVSRLRIALEAEDLSELEFISHRLRGAFAYLGSSGLAARAAALEKAAREGNLALTRNLTFELTQELETFLTEGLVGESMTPGSNSEGGPPSQD